MVIGPPNGRLRCAHDTHRCVFRPRQDDHREVEHARVHRPFYHGGLINRAVRDPQSAYAQFVYLVGGADHDQMERMRQYLSEMVTGWDVADRQRDRRRHSPPRRRPARVRRGRQLIEEHHAEGHDVVIVSASGTEVVEPIGAMLGADHVIATLMEIEDGRYTGEIEFYAYAREQGRRHPRAGRATAATTWRVVRLLRLRHRPPDAGGRRPPVRGQPRQGAPQGSPRNAAGTSSSSTSRSRCAAACSPRPRRPWPRWPSGAPSRSPAASSGRATKRRRLGA